MMARHHSSPGQLAARSLHSCTLHPASLLRGRRPPEDSIWVEPPRSPPHPLDPKSRRNQPHRQAIRGATRGAPTRPTPVRSGHQVPWLPALLGWLPPIRIDRHIQPHRPDHGVPAPADQTLDRRTVANPSSTPRDPMRDLTRAVRVTQIQCAYVPSRPTSSCTDVILLRPRGIHPPLGRRWVSALGPRRVCAQPLRLLVCISRETRRDLLAG